MEWEEPRLVQEPKRRHKLRAFAKTFFTLVSGLVGLGFMLYAVIDYPVIKLDWFLFGAGWTLATAYWVGIANAMRWS